MSDPNSAIPEHAQPHLWRRYETYRAQRYERSLVKYAGRWPSLRNQRSFRRLVVLLIAMLILTLVGGFVAFVSDLWFLPPFMIGIVGVATTLTVIRIVTGSNADAPVSVLDEIQLAQRNSARSIGYIVLFSLMFVPYLLLIFLGSTMDQVSGQTVYGCGVLLIGLVLIGSSTPTMLTAWWMADPDPEDFAVDDDVEDTPEPETPAAPSQPAPEPAPRARERERDLDPPAPAPW